jgi:signal transduction histidine kinase
MSHEIRTPLNAIVGMTGLRSRRADTARARLLGKIRASAHLLAEIIEDILDLSRIEAGRLEIQRIEFDLDELLAELADVVGARVGERNLEILFAAAPDVPRACAATRCGSSRCCSTCSATRSSSPRAARSWSRSG